MLHRRADAIGAGQAPAGCAELMTTLAASGSRYTMVSADAHAGGDIQDYRPYLASRGTTSSTPGPRST